MFARYEIEFDFQSTGPNSITFTDRLPAAFQPALSWFSSIFPTLLRQLQLSPIISEFREPRTRRTDKSKKSGPVAFSVRTVRARVCRWTERKAENWMPAGIFWGCARWYVGVIIRATKKWAVFFSGGGGGVPVDFGDFGRLLHMLGCCTGDLGSRNPFALRAFYFLGAMSNVSIWKALKSATESNGNPPKFTSVAECFLSTPAPYLFLSLCLRSLSVVIRLFVNNPDSGDSATCTPRTSGKSNDQDVLQNIHTYMYAQWIYRFQNSTFKAFNTTFKGRCLSIHSNNLF